MRIQFLQEEVIVLSIRRDHAVLICGQSGTQHFNSIPHQTWLFKYVEHIKSEYYHWKLSALDIHPHTQSHTPEENKKKKLKIAIYLAMCRTRLKPKNTSFYIDICLSIYLIRKMSKLSRGLQSHVK